MEENDIPQEIIASLNGSQSWRLLNDLAMRTIYSAEIKYSLSALIGFEIQGKMDGLINIVPTNQHECYLNSLNWDGEVSTFLCFVRYYMLR